jgi:hypothetical protein
MRGKYRCEDAQGMAQQHPDTFEVDSIAELRNKITTGSVVKVCVLIDMDEDDDGPGAERIWVQVTDVDDFKIKATFLNHPMFFDAQHGDELEFHLRHIFSVYDEPLEKEIG